MDWPTILTLGGTVIATGIALAAIIIPGQREMRRDVAGLRERMASLEGRMSGVEGQMTMLANLFMQRKEPSP